MNAKELKSLSDIGQSSMRAGDMSTALLVVRHIFEFHAPVAEAAMDLLALPEDLKEKMSAVFGPFDAVKLMQLLPPQEGVNDPETI